MPHGAGFHVLYVGIQIVGVVAKFLQHAAIGLHGSLDDRVGAAGHDLHPMTRGEGQTFGSRGAIPERRIGLLLWRELDRRAGKLVALAAMRNPALAQTLDDYLERFLENRARLQEVDIQVCEFVGRNTPRPTPTSSRPPLN